MSTEVSLFVPVKFSLTITCLSMRKKNDIVSKALKNNIKSSLLCITCSKKILLREYILATHTQIWLG